MTTDKLPTAKELINKYKLGNPTLINPDTCGELMKEFAKLHVEAALKAAAEKVHLVDYGGKERGTGAIQFSNGNDFHVNISKDSILNAYDLNNIK